MHQGSGKSAGHGRRTSTKPAPPARGWLLAFLLTVVTGPALAECADRYVLQILGSGGPIADDGRASSGYLLWVDGKARLLVDAGGGIFQRFGESGAAIDDLDAIVLTHLHTDHAADLPALLKGGYFSSRRRPMPLIGPTGAGAWPGMQAFVERLFGTEGGAFAYLDGLLDGSGGLFALDVTEVDAKGREPQTVFASDRFRLKAVGVRHGPVPALGLLIQTPCGRIAVSGDQSDDNPHFAGFIHGADLLVMHHAIPASAGEQARALHATPRRIGELAADAGVRRLVLSHLMGRSIDALAESLKLIRQAYDGRVTVADDLLRVPLDLDAKAR